MNVTSRARRGSCGFALPLLAMVASCAFQPRETVPDVESVGEPASFVFVNARNHPGLTVMTLNTGHARGSGVHQLLQSRKRAKRNLDTIAELMMHHRPDIVALQESDRASFWSGRFDHVAYLAVAGRMRQFVRGDHAIGPGLAYGTALVSQLALIDPVAVTFRPRAPPLPKGFVVSTIPWPHAPSVEIDVVSVHLDPLRPRIRLHQAQELVRTMRERGRPAIVMGDLNAEWGDEKSVVKLLASELDLVAFEPDSGDLKTHPRRRKRLDWILLSHEFEFLSYHILDAVVSDHRAVIAQVRLRAGADKVAVTAQPAQ